ncbi:MAG: hypothetical protein CENE_03145 [Candidatus Celerinatantimonas neptuna]|nr:MAG: hypothetical protein CENE_03145 [Candidatus Celerinatantimonas neptuna]
MKQMKSPVIGHLVRREQVIYNNDYLSNHDNIFIMHDINNIHVVSLPSDSTQHFRYHFLSMFTGYISILEIFDGTS